MKQHDSASRKSGETQKTSLFHSVLFVGVLSIAAACAPAQGPSAQNLAERAGNNLGCTQSFEDEFWNGIYEFAVQKENFASPKEMRAAFNDAFAKGRLKSLNGRDRQRMSEALAELYELLAFESLQTLTVEQGEHQKALATLTGLEIGDRTTEEKAVLQDKIRSKFSEIDRLSQQLSDVPTCPGTGSAPAPGPGAVTPAPVVPGLISEWKATRHPAVYGGLKSLATAYQSCDAGLRGAMASSSSAVQGISVVGTHPNGVGSQRKITDLAALLRTHHYLKSYQRPGSSCFAVTGKPMIYDYGGKPSTGTADDSPLDFFRDAGTGTSELGIDCSGYVYSALATAGLKLKKTGKLKAINVHGVPARMYMDPQGNGMNCFDYARFTSMANLRPGDLLASSGHIVMIETVGADPFGISNLRTESQCKTENISVSRFDFTILQSSPSKGGIGINRMRGADYLSDGGSMRTAMIQHAVNACLAKARGTAVTTRSSSASLVRHLGTSECVDRPIRLVKEECVSSCTVPQAQPLLF